MARETRIGMALMTLLLGAFGVMAYQRWNSEQPTLLAAAGEMREELEAVENTDATEKSNAGEAAPAPATLGKPTPHAVPLTDAPPSPFGNPASDPATLADTPEVDAPEEIPANPFAGAQAGTSDSESAAPPPVDDPFGDMAADGAAPAKPAASVPVESVPLPGDPFSTASTETTSPPVQPAPEQTETAPPVESLPFATDETASADPMNSSPAMPVPDLEVAEAEPFGAVSLAPETNETRERGTNEPAESVAMEESPFGEAPTGPASTEPAPSESKPESGEAAVTLSDDPFAGLDEPASPEIPATEPPGDPDALADAAAPPVTLEQDPFGAAPAPEQPASTALAPGPDTAMADAPFGGTESTAVPTADAATNPSDPPAAPSPFGAAPPESAPAPAAAPFGATPTPEAETAPAPNEIPPESNSEAIGHYVVQENDNYWTISKSVYDSPIYAHALAQFNASTIPDPRNLKPGTKVPTPPVEELQRRYAALIATGSRAVARSEPRTGFFMTETNQPAYRVSESDTLENIAQSHLGRSSRWVQIFEMNRDAVEDPKALEPGTILKLPVDASRVNLVPRGDVRE